jgi:hypothetical protein
LALEQREGKKEKQSRKFSRVKKTSNRKRKEAKNIYA